MTEWKQKQKAIATRELTLKRDKEALLYDAGWQYSANYPDHCWRWSKMVDGEKLTTSSADEAVSMECCINGR